MKQYKVIVNGKEFEISMEETTYGKHVANPAPVQAQAQAVPQLQNTAVSKASVGSGTKVNAPMPGTVLKIKASNGSTVKKGDPIIVLEAMKMENEIAATADGTINICVSEGDKINSGDVIATIA